MKKGIHLMENSLKENDNLFLKGIKKGSKQSFENLFKAYYELLFNYLYRLSSDEFISEDCLQNVFLNIWIKRNSLQIKSSLKNYLLRSCHNEFLMHLRKKKKEFDILDTLKWEAISEIFIEEEHKLEDDLIQLEKHIEELPNKCKQAFKLSKIERKKHKEISAIMDISTKTVEAHISKAVRLLKTKTKNQ